MATALLLIDIQNDYFPGGSMELEGSQEAGLRARELLEFFRVNNLPVVHIQHVATRPGATFFLPETEGVKIHPQVEPRPGEAVFQKNYPNSFRETPLLDHLRELGVDHLVVGGMMTHMCVDATVRAAFDYDFTITVAHDACATRPLVFHGQTVASGQVQAAFLAALSVPYARIVSARDFIQDFR
jgi:nicotinamidase-related amidase